MRNWTAQTSAAPLAGSRQCTKPCPSLPMEKLLSTEPIPGAPKVRGCYFIQSFPPIDLFLAVQWIQGEEANSLLPPAHPPNNCLSTKSGCNWWRFYFSVMQLLDLVFFSAPSCYINSQTGEHLCINTSRQYFFKAGTSHSLWKYPNPWFPLIKNYREELGLGDQLLSILDNAHGVYKIMQECGLFTCLFFLSLLQWVEPS